MLEEKKSIKFMRFFTKYQKAVIMCFFISFIVLFVYCLAFCTPFHDLLAVNGILTFKKLNNLGCAITKEQFALQYPGALNNSGQISCNYFTTIINDLTQNFNNMLFYFSLSGIIVSLLLFVYRSQLRKKYYVTNFAVNSLCSIFSLVTCITLFVNLENTLNKLSNIDYTYINARNTDINFKDSNVIVNTFGTFTYNYIFVIGRIVLILMLICAILLATLTIFKFLVNKYDAEKKLQNKIEANAGGTLNE